MTPVSNTSSQLDLQRNANKLKTLYRINHDKRNDEYVCKFVVTLRRLLPFSST